MKRIAISILGFAFLSAQAAAPAPAAPTNATPAPSSVAPAESEASPSAVPTKEALQQAFDGAMTCSALSALNGQQAGKDEVWRWKNRSFAFGMLAAHFYVDATKDKLSNEDMDNMLTEYANSLSAMKPKDREPFDTGCARKYAQVDKLCEVNSCPNAAPGTPEFKPPAGAPAPKSK